MRHQFLALVAHHVRQCRRSEHAAQRRIEQDGKLRTGAVGADRLIIFERVGNAVAREGVDHEPLAGLPGAGIGAVAARGDHLLRRLLDGENALVDIDHAVDERHFHVKSGLGDDAHRIAEPDHQRLSGLINGEKGAVADDGRDQEHYGGHAADETEFHGLPPVVASGAGAAALA